MTSSLRQRLLYWTVQSCAWGLYVGIILLSHALNGTFNATAVREVPAILAIGLLVSHLFRILILRNAWLGLGIARLLPALLFGSVVLGSSAFLLQGWVNAHIQPYP
jgi:hypothetical protein